MLVAAGYDVTTLHCVEAAIDALKESTFDAVIAGQLLSHREKNHILDVAYKHGVSTISIHVLPTDETIQAECYVRVTEGADGLLAAIVRTMTKRKHRAQCRPVNA